jgi:carbamate kinase
VVRGPEGELTGCDAVIDKDHAAVLLSKEAQSDILVLVTDVDYCYEHFGTPSQVALKRLTLANARRLLDEGHFHEGSMRPKVEACVNFVADSGKPAIITSLNKVSDALDPETGVGTWFTPS